jgi:hypothetical protein
VRQHPSPTPLAAPSLHRPDHSKIYFFNRIEHFEQFPPHRPNAGYVIGKETVARGAGVGEVRRKPTFAQTVAALNT